MEWVECRVRPRGEIKWVLDELGEKSQCEGAEWEDDLVKLRIILGPTLLQDS